MSEGNIHLGGLVVHGRKILKLILKKLNVNMWVGLNWLEIGSNGRFL